MDTNNSIKNNNNNALLELGEKSGDFSLFIKIF